MTYYDEDISDIRDNMNEVISNYCEEYVKADRLNVFSTIFKDSCEPEFDKELVDNLINKMGMDKWKFSQTILRIMNVLCSSGDITTDLCLYTDEDTNSDHSMSLNNDINQWLALDCDVNGTDNTVIFNVKPKEKNNDQ